MSFLRLEVFGHDREAEATSDRRNAAIEAARKEGFEAGYLQGHQAANELRTGAEAANRAQLVAILAEQSLTLNQARDMALQSLAPLILTALGKVLPELAARSLPLLLAETLAKHLDRDGEIPIEIGCSPSQRSLVAQALTAHPEVKITPRPELAEGQLSITLQESELAINQPGAIEAVLRLIEDYFAHPQTNLPRSA